MANPRDTGDKALYSHPEFVQLLAEHLASPPLECFA